MKEHEDPPSFPSPLASSLAPSSPGCRYLWCSGAQCVPRKRTQKQQAEAPQTRICEENTVAGRRPPGLNFWDPIRLVLGTGKLGGQELRGTPASLAPPLNYGEMVLSALPAHRVDSKWFRLSLQLVYLLAFLS